NFYKVQLARDDYAYILKEDVIQTNIPTEQANIENYVYEETDKARYFKIKLSNKTPYILSENDGLDLVIYNVKGFPENKYEFHINKIDKLFGYRSYYKNNSELVIEVKKYPIINPQTPLSGLKIAIDAGHGGNEIGTIGCLGHKEKDVNLQVANILQDKLVTKGAKVQNLRVDDYDLSLTDRVEMAQYLNPDIFVSIHHNAPPDSAAFKHKSGSSVFYFYHQAKPLAKAIQKRLTQDLGMKDDTVKAQSFAVVRNTNSIAVLVEIGYMTDPEDNSKIIDQKFQEKAADAIIHGLEDYLNGIQ
ncbi:N-acetylmuramoyl-L-alanine amidase, partial [bacterium]|nr:N-acetylmuramoyl-L-alanine amidase [bacterium]